MASFPEIPRSAGAIHRVLPVQAYFLAGSAATGAEVAAAAEAATGAEAATAGAAGAAASLAFSPQAVRESASREAIRAVRFILVQFLNMIWLNTSLAAFSCQRGRAFYSDFQKNQIGFTRSGLRWEILTWKRHDLREREGRLTRNIMQACSTGKTRWIHKHACAIQFAALCLNGCDSDIPLNAFRMAGLP